MRHYVHKNAPPVQLVAAVRATAAGDAQLAPAIVERILEEFVRRPPPGNTRPAALDRLTDRELGVLMQLARGLSNAVRKLGSHPAVLRISAIAGATSPPLLGRELRPNECGAPLRASLDSQRSAGCAPRS